jgi:general secretion pathway protein D
MNRTISSLLLSCSFVLIAACKSTPEIKPPATLEIHAGKPLEPGLLLPEENIAGRIVAVEPKGRNISARNSEVGTEAAVASEAPLPLQTRLDGVSISDFVALMARPEVLNFPYVLDAQAAAGKVTIDLGQAHFGRSGAEALLQTVLRMNNLTIESGPGGVRKIIPSAKAGRSEGACLAILQIPGLTAQEAMTVLKPLLPESCQLQALPRSGAFIVCDSLEGIARAKEIAAQMAIKGPAGWPVAVIPLKEMAPSKIIAELRSILPVLGLPIDGDGAVRMAAVERTKMLLVCAATPSAIEEIRSWVNSLDVAEAGQDLQLYRYPVRHGVARDMMLKTAAFFPNASTTFDQGPENRAEGGTGSAPPPQVQAPRPAGDKDAAPTGFQESVAMVEDARQNQIILRLSPRAWRLARPLLESLDAPPLQCIVEITAVDVSLSSNLQYGVTWALEKKFGSNIGNVGSGNAGAKAPNFNAGTVTPGLNGMLQRAGATDEFALLQALDTDIHSEVLFRPKLLTTNGRSAEIQIGQSIPLDIGSTVTDGGNQITNTQYKDTGVILKVTPRISAGRSVGLSIDQEISASNGEARPTINKTHLKTELTVKDGEMILLGGMITRDNSDSASGIPFLKDIPLLGWLFSGKTDKAVRKELILFLKVNVVENAPGPAALAEEYRRAIEMMKRKDVDP